MLIVGNLSRNKEGLSRELIFFLGSVGKLKGQQESILITIETCGDRIFCRLDESDNNTDTTIGSLYCKEVLL